MKVLSFFTGLFREEAAFRLRPPGGSEEVFPRAVRGLAEWICIEPLRPNQGSERSIRAVLENEEKVRLVDKIIVQPDDVWVVEAEKRAEFGVVQFSVRPVGDIHAGILHIAFYTALAVRHGQNKPGRAAGRFTKRKP